MLRRVNGRHKEFPMSQTSRPPKGIGTATFTLAGIAAAFGLAACCALPFLLASVGLGAAWRAGVAVVAAPYRPPLLTIGALRSEERRVGKEWACTCRSRWSPYH